MISFLRLQAHMTAADIPEVQHLWEGEVKTFSFDNSAKALVQKVERCKSLHEPLLSSFQSNMSKLLGEDKKFQWGEFKVVSLRDYFQNIKAEDYLVLSWKMGQEQLMGYLVMDRSFFSLLYGALFAGPRFYKKEGPLTSIEKKYFTRMVEGIFVIIAQAWSAFGPYKLSLNQLILEPENISKITSEGDFVEAPFQVSFSETMSQFLFIYPKEALNLFESADSTTGQQVKTQKDEKWERGLLGAISETEMNVQVELGKIYLPLSKSIDLKLGEVFPLELDEEGHKVFVEGKQAFFAKMGSLGEQKAAQIISSAPKNS